MAASVTDIAAGNPNGNKTLLANGLRKLRNPPSWLVIFLAVPFSKILLFSKNFNYFHNIFYFIIS